MLVMLFALTGLYNQAKAQSVYELNSGWQCAPIADVKEDGFKISNASYNTAAWMKATVPGTVLTTLLNNKRYQIHFME